jgi:TolB protein
LQGILPNSFYFKPSAQTSDNKLTLALLLQLSRGAKPADTANRAIDIATVSGEVAMTSMHGKILRWLLSGGAFIAVITAAAGCSQSAPQPASPVEVAKPLAANDPHSVFPDPADLKPPVINVFGELDGNEAKAPHAYGETGLQQQSFLDEGYDSDVALDPAGKWMIFASTRQSEHPNLYMQRVDGTSVMQLTNDEADYAYPVFSPDGKSIAFCSTRGGNWDIYIMDSEGKNVSQVTTGPMQHVHPSFSPDGSRLVYSAMGGKSGQWELWVVDLTTGEKRMIGFGLFPSWCPAKGVDRIAFQRARQRGGRWFSLWTLDLIDNEARHITELAVSSNAAIVSPSWNPDGTKVAFATIAEPSSIVGVKPMGQQDIWTVNADGTSRHRLTDGVAMNLSPFWAADNRIYFITDRTGIECVWSVRADAPSKPAGGIAAKPHDTDVVGATDTRDATH